MLCICTNVRDSAGSVCSSSRYTPQYTYRPAAAPP